ncbi:kinase-like domain-containing protein [Rhizophagus clarus]|uniref:Kinase-like domain-containing protein n=1 Tax=Rhizophagus clarus TaxID=94130 RepID=A0A8H3MFY1_9GLOM|nr:kinase-like domain-containing protein [Rhizophagus clarus]
MQWKYSWKQNGARSEGTNNIAEKREIEKLTKEIGSTRKDQAHIKLPNISPDIFQLVLRYIYGGRLSLEEFDTSDIIKILVVSKKCMIALIQRDNFRVNTIQVWEHVLKWGVAQNPELPTDPSSYSKDDFNVLKNILQQFIPLIKFHNLSPNEFVDKVYPYKKVIPKELRDKLIKDFIIQPNNNQSNITKEFDSMAMSRKQKHLSIEKDFNVVIYEINDFIRKIVNEAPENKLLKQKVDEYFKNHNISAQEIYNWLLNNQVNANSIFLLGYFNFYGIVTSEDNEKAINLFINASEKNHTLAQCFVGIYYGNIMTNYELAFKYFERAASNHYAVAQWTIGCMYINGIGIDEDFKKAFYWNGIGIEKDYNKAFELYKQSAEGGNSDGIVMLGRCHSKGIGTKIDKQKAFELYQNAANLGLKEAQYFLALMYEKGNGIKKDIDKAIYWFNESANQGHENAKNKLKTLK